MPIGHWARQHIRAGSLARTWAGAAGLGEPLAIFIPVYGRSFGGRGDVAQRSIALELWQIVGCLRMLNFKFCPELREKDSVSRYTTQ